MSLEPSDNDLIASAQKGDQSALDVLIKRYLKSIYNFIYRFLNEKHEVSDLTQEVFIKVWKNISKFNPRKNFKTWLFVIARNTTFDYLKKKKDLPFSAFFDQEKNENFLESIPETISLEEEIQQLESKENLNLAIEKLPTPYQVILNLYYKNDFNFREIAEILKESFNTIKSRHRRALLMLKDILKKI